MKKTMIYTIATVIATVLVFVVTAVTAGITNGFDYLFEDAASTVGSVIIWAIGTWLEHAIYCVANKIARKMEEKEKERKMEEYDYIVEKISKKLGL